MPHDPLPVNWGVGPTVAAQLLPLGGIAFVGWELAEVLAIYWLELWAVLVVYAGAALFAERPVVLEGRTIHLPGVSRRSSKSRDRWDGEQTGIEFAAWLPPIYPRNGRLVGWSLVWGIGFCSLPVLAFGFGAIESVLAPGVVLAAIAIGLSQIAYVARTFFGEERYADMSVHMVLEIPVRLITFAFAFLLTVVVLGAGIVILGAYLAEVLVGYEMGPRIFEALLATPVVFGRLAVEWSRTRAETADDPSGFATWFTPQNPRESIRRA